MKVNSKIYRALIFVTYIVIALAFPEIAKATDFSNKTIQFIVPYREGGGSDVYARLFAPFLEKHLPGNPTVLVRNMPGGASVRGNNFFEAKAKPDGLSLVSISISTKVSYLLGGKKVKFDMLKWRTFIASPFGTVIYIHPDVGFSLKNPADSIKKIQDKELRYGAKTVIGGELLPFLSYEILGLKIKPVFGLSRGKARQAMMRNEIQINNDLSSNYIRKVGKLIKAGKAAPMMTMGFLKKGKIVRDPAVPNIPTVIELAEKVNGKKPAGPLYEAWRTFFNLGVVSTTGLALPKGTSDKIYNAYVQSIKKTLADPRFNKRAENILGNYDQLTGSDANQAMQDAVTMKPDVKRWLTGWISKKFNVTVDN